MRTPFLFKVGSLVILGVCTSFLTSSIMGQYRMVAPNRAQASDLNVKPRQVRILKASKSGTTRNVRSWTAKPLAEFNFRDLTVFSVGNSVGINGGVDIFDRRPNIYYLWRIRIKNDATDKIVMEKYYTDQTFTYDNGVNSHPNFAERLELDRGNYKVELTLYNIPLGFDIRRLSDDDVSKGQRCASRVRSISVNF